MNQPRVKTQIENFISHCVENGQAKVSAKKDCFDQFEIMDAAPFPMSVFHNGGWKEVAKRTEVKELSGPALFVQGVNMVVFVDGKKICTNA